MGIFTRKSREVEHHRYTKETDGGPVSIEYLRVTSGQSIRERTITLSMGDQVIALKEDEFFDLVQGIKDLINLWGAK